MSSNTPQDPPSPPPSIAILPASPPDFPTMAHISARAMAPDLVNRIIHPGPDPLDTSPQEAFVLAELQRASQNPLARVLKAVVVAGEGGEVEEGGAMEKEVGRIVGYALFRFVDDVGGVGKTKGTGPAAGSWPAGTNMEFVRRVGEAVGEIYGKYMVGGRHVWWSSLMVLPQYQFKGIGSALLRHGFDDLGADQVPICLVTQLRGREIYLKFAFEDVDVIDIDMSDFAGPYRGFGIHRNVFMVRQPGGVPGKGPKAEIKW